MINRIIKGGLAILTLTALIPVEVRAMTYEEALATSYDALVTQKQNAVSFVCEDDGFLDRVTSLKFYEDLVAIDDKASLYDGLALDIRGIETITPYEDNYYTFEIVSGYDVEEADALTDQMVEEIKERLPEEPTERKIYKEMVKYIQETFSYDFMFLINGRRINFVDAYYGDHKTICTGFATLSYLLANKLGLDCRIYMGQGHTFNGIRFEGDEKYTTFDLSCCLYPLGFVPAIMELTPDFNGFGDRKERCERLNTDPRRYASPMDLYEVLKS